MDESRCFQLKFRGLNPRRDLTIFSSDCQTLSFNKDGADKKALAREELLGYGAGAAIGLRAKRKDPIDPISNMESPSTLRNHTTYHVASLGELLKRSSKPEVNIP